MPSPGVTSGLQICGVIAALAAAAGVASRSSLSLAVVSSLVLDGMLNSTGRVIVGDAVLTLCLLVILASAPAASEAWAAGPWLRRCRRRARAPAQDTDSKEPSVGPRYGWPIRTAMVTIALSLFFAGFQKLRYSGIAWVTSGNLRWILYASSDSSLHPNALALFIADRPWLAHLCAAGALLLETCFPVVLFVPRLRWYLVAGVLAMHEAIRLAIGLDYRVQGLAMLVVFVDWPAVVEWVGTEVGSRGHVVASNTPRSGALSGTHDLAEQCGVDRAVVGCEPQVPRVEVGQGGSSP